MPENTISTSDSDTVDIPIRFGADSALPTPLQGIPYSKDVWRRIKSHPVVSPKLKRDELADDSETRELVHTILEAAGEREKEILLYNQARVFSVVLQSVIDGFGKFLSRPVVPIKRIATANNSSESDATGAESDGASKRPLWQSILISFLIPKYIIFVVLAVLGLAVGFSQWRNYQMQQTINTLKESGEAAEISRNSLNQLRDEYKIMQDRAAKEQQNVQKELSRLRENNFTLETKNASLNETIKSLNERLKKEKKEESDLEKNVADLKQKLAAANRQVESSANRLSDSQKAKEQAISSYRELKTQYDKQINANAKLASENTLLQKYRTSFGIAKTAFDSIKREANRYSPNITNIRNSLNLSEKTIQQTLNQ